MNVAEISAQLRQTHFDIGVGPIPLKHRLDREVMPQNRGQYGATGVLTDSQKSQFVTTAITGISLGQLQMQTEYSGAVVECFDPSTEIKPSDSTDVTLTFSSQNGNQAAVGLCSVQFGIFTSDGLIEGHAKHTATRNLNAKIEAK